MQQNRSENIIYLIIWLVVVFLPVFTLQGGRDFNQTRVYMEWIRLIPFLLIFIVNNSVLVPGILFRKKTLLFVTLATVLIIIITMLSPNLRYIQNLVFEWQQQKPPLAPNRLMSRTPEYNFATNVLISFLVVGFNSAIKLLLQREKEEKLRGKRDKIHLQTELSFLRNQISPHFFMNTLNNIHALIKFDATQAQKSIVQLSMLMRYLLNDSKSGSATIKDEFGFLKSYIDLMRIRYSESVRITVDLEVEHGNSIIPSLLFVSLVENAFKYGTDNTSPSFIEIGAHTANDELTFEVKNSICVHPNSETKTGLGLSNLKKQLSLLYESNFSLTIADRETEYHVKLVIPLNHDQMHSS
jgi:LytS/YehU family sensor histidine kinase